MKTSCFVLGAVLTALSLHTLSGQSARVFILAAETNQTVPGPTGPVTLSTITQPRINARGEIVFRAQVAGGGVTTANDEAIYRRDPAGVVNRLFGEGDLIGAKTQV